MFLDIKVEEQKFKLAVGQGYNDWVWLAHYASRVYAKAIYPQGVYIPALLYLQTKNSELHPHPRERIKFYLEYYQLQPKDLTVILKIRKANHIFTDFEKKWELQAFGDERYLSQIKYSYRVTNVNRKKDFFFKVTVTSKPSEQIRGLVDQQKFKPVHNIILTERQVSTTQSYFEGSIKLPYGHFTHKLFYLQRESENQEYQEHQLRDHKIKAEDFKVAIQPKYIPQESMHAMVQQDMKITESINKSLQERQLQAKKRNTNSSLCCYSFEQLWQILEHQYGKELYFGDYEQSTKERIKISLEKSMNELYQIFFYYFIVDSQQRDKKQQLSITYQQVMHFLRDYQVFPEMRDLLSFVEFYNGNGKFKIFQDTLDVSLHGIRFPQFVAILLRAIQFLQTSTFMMKGQTFDSAVAKIFQKVIDIEKEEDEFTEFRRNIRQNAKVIAFIRNNSEQLKKIFAFQARASVQNTITEFCIKKEQVKRMLQMGKITDKNLNLVVDECFGELKLKEDGVFYYDFLIIVQWLAMTVISTDKEGEQLENEQQESLMIVEKIKYLIDKVEAAI